MRETRNRRSNLPALLTAVEVAHRLGVSPSSVYRWCKAGEIPSVRIAGTVRIPTTELERLLETRPAA